MVFSLGQHQFVQEVFQLAAIFHLQKIIQIYFGEASTSIDFWTVDKHA